MKPTLTIIPAAGLGTRVVPLTVAVAKELVPLGDRPLFQWTLAEAERAGVRRVIVVTSPGKTLSPYYNPSRELRGAASKGGAAGAQWLDLIDRLIFQEVVQETPRGLGDAVLQAEPCIDEPYFFVQLPDEWYPDGDCLQQLAAAVPIHPLPILAVMEVPADHTNRYGIVKPAIPLSEIQPGQPFPIADLVEKPQPADAPSCLAITGRYLLPRSLFAMLHDLPAGSGGEIQLTDAIRRLLEVTEVLALPFTGIRHDIGNHRGYQDAWKAWLRNDAVTNESSEESTESPV